MRVHSHYDNLKVARDAPLSVIKAAYRALAQQYHPDKNPGDAEAVRITQIINEAWAVLSEPALRAEHDAWLRSRERLVAAAAAAQSARADARQAPPEPQPPVSPPPPPPPRPPAPASTKATQRSHVKLFAFGMVLVAGWYLWSEAQTQAPRERVAAYDPKTATSAETGAASARGGPRPSGRVNTTRLNMRSGPGTSHPVIAKLQFLDEVELGPATQAGWVAVRHPAGSGYVNTRFVLAGPPAETLQTLCPLDAPASGTVFSTKGRGDNALTVKSPPDAHVWVKLKDDLGATKFSAFVRRGQREQFHGIPDGRYQTWFAAGNDFSAKCQRFLEPPATLFDPAYQEFRTRRDAFNSYSTNMEYSLTLQRGGNFSPSRGSYDVFMLD